MINKILIEDAAYRWFDMKYKIYDKLEYEGSIYCYYADSNYLEYDGEKFAEIRISSASSRVYYITTLYDEFYDIFKISRVFFESILTKWVESTFSFDHVTPVYFDGVYQPTLRIPQ